MTQLRSCADCGAFVPPTSARCPCCRQTASPAAWLGRVPTPVKALLGVAGGGLLSVTLSACYGAPCTGGACGPPPDAGPDPMTCIDPREDLDGDGYCLDYDCDESDADVNADAFDPEGDMLDQNCDGVDGTLSVDAGT
ncbi:MAG TPA: hypothetical protein RMH99_22410 [Sandaracinaceae bacterium LLY-WYZ-13_1]|nr:hypothetical protein [Sandaracinaceae bacterium LLY-WYZ-13_1]